MEARRVRLVHEPRETNTEQIFESAQDLALDRSRAWQLRDGQPADIMVQPTPNRCWETKQPSLHQAQGGSPPSMVVLTVADHANTSSASIPLALGVAVGDRRIKEGDLVLIEAMADGFTWGPALIRW